MWLQLQVLTRANPRIPGCHVSQQAADWLCALWSKQLLCQFPTQSLGPAAPRQTFAFHEDHKSGVELVGGQLFLEVKRPLPFDLVIGDAVVLITPPHRATLRGEITPGREKLQTRKGSYGPGGTTRASSQPSTAQQRPLGEPRSVLNPQHTTETSALLLLQTDLC